MTIITRYIIKEHIGPFLYGLGTIILLLILNVFFRDLGRLLGKGLGLGVVLEFFVYHLAWITALAIPMAVLIATLMAFGRLSSENEIAALKASGIHLYRLIFPILIIASILAIGMERFNNCVLPDFNHRLRTLSSDISRKRPSLAIEPHVFFDNIPNYNMLVHDIDLQNDILTGIVINDHSKPNINRTITAKKGRLRFSEEQEAMIFTLFDGEIHEVNLKNLEQYRRLRFFEEHIISIPVSNMELKRSNTDHRSDREKSAAMMRRDIQNNIKVIETRQKRIQTIAETPLKNVFPAQVWSDNIIIKNNRVRKPITRRENIRQTNRLVQQIQGEKTSIHSYRRSTSSLKVETEKKYSIPVACIVFVLIGAPLGIMARQGGLAVGGGLSVVFFLIYWSFLIGGEQLADRLLISPAMAMWSPNILVGALGILLVVRTVKETTFINWDAFKVLKKKKQLS